VVCFIDCDVAFDLDEICVSLGLMLKVTCSKLSPAVGSWIGGSHAMSFAFHLLNGQVVTCGSSPCQCVDVNITAVQLSCPYLPMEYDHANLSCYVQDHPFVSIRAPVYVRGNPCLASQWLGILSEVEEIYNTLSLLSQTNQVMMLCVMAGVLQTKMDA